MKKHIIPMNAYIGTTKDLEHKDFIYEPKLDGIRALCYVNKKMTFISRNEKDLTKRFPELQERDAITASSCIIDGEIVAFDKKGVPRFQLLQEGMPGYFIVFDILEHNNKSVINLPLLERKKILDATIKDSPHIQKIIFTKNGKALWHEVNKRHLEGVMVKKADGTYQPGIRSRTWLKVKLFNTIDCIIIGFTTGKRIISSLALGLYDGKKIIYIGKVGTGFTEEFLHTLHRRLLPIITKKVPETTEDVRDITWIKPHLVAEIKFVEITKAHILRSPVFVRIRDDKKPKNCTTEDQLIPFLNPGA